MADKKRKRFPPNSDFNPSCSKKRKLSHASNEHRGLYNKIIHLLNCGKISYSNSKREIREILVKEYNIKEQDLKKNPEFRDAIMRLMVPLMSSDTQSSNTNHTRHTSHKTRTSSSNITHKQSNNVPPIIQNIPSCDREPKTFRECKAELSSKSRGCYIHGLGQNITFKQDRIYLYMLCNLCSNQAIAEMKLPQHLMMDIKENMKNMNMNTNTNTNNKRTKKNLDQWNSHEIIYWMNRVDSGVFNDIKYIKLKRQIVIGNIKGFELQNINDTTLKLLEMQHIKDRNLVLKYIKDLVQRKDAILMKSIPIYSVVPIAFYDPILFEIMKDPVIVTVSGHYYERQMIEKYVKQFQMDPISKQKVTLNDLVSNEAVKTLVESIKLWKSQNMKSDVADVNHNTNLKS